MRHNTSNFSAHIFRSTPFTQENIDLLLGGSITILGGCNGAVTGASSRYMYLFLKKDDIKIMCDETKKTFEEILEEISNFGFKFKIFESKATGKYEFLSHYTTINESIIVELDLRDYTSSRHRYYAFCMFRHFYYGQNVLFNYLNICDKNDSEFDRIKKLSWCSINSSVYTFLPPIVCKEVTVKELVAYFNKVASNTIGPYGLYLGETKEPYATTIEKTLNIMKELSEIPKTSTSFILYNAKDNSKMDIFKQYKISDFKIRGMTIDINTGSWDQYIAYRFPVELEKYLNKVPRSKDYIKLDNQVQCGNKETYYIFNPDNSYCLTNQLVDRLYTFDYKSYLDDIDKTKKRYEVEIKSRHPSHRVFRKVLESTKKVLIRLGSTTKATKEYDVVLNSEEAITNSSSKLLMKRCFINGKVTTPEYVYQNSIENVISALAGSNIEYPIVAKHILGSRGTGNYKLDSEQELLRWSKGRNIENYIFEKFKNFAKEYRIHVSTNGVFLMWRKLRRNDTPANQKWFFNNSNCNWISEKNPLFDAPVNLSNIQNECIKALKSVGLDFGACDVRVQSNLNKDGNERKNSSPEFSIIEINSAPSMAEVTASVYLKEFVRLIDKK